MTALSTDPTVHAFRFRAAVADTSTSDSWAYARGTGEGRGRMKDLRGLQNAVRHVADPLVRLRHVVDEALVLVPRADGATVELIGEDGWLTCVCCAGSVAPYVGTRIRADGSISGLSIVTGDVLWAE